MTMTTTTATTKKNRTTRRRRTYEDRALVRHEPRLELAMVDGKEPSPPPQPARVVELRTMPWDRQPSTCLPARLVDIGPRLDDPEARFEEECRGRALAGRYRVIHGTVLMPIRDERTGRPFTRVGPGSIVELDDIEAARMVDAGVVEPAETPEEESRLGRCHQLPPPPPPGFIVTTPVSLEPVSKNLSLVWPSTSLPTMVWPPR